MKKTHKNILLGLTLLTSTIGAGQNIQSNKHQTNKHLIDNFQKSGKKNPGNTASYTEAQNTLHEKIVHMNLDVLIKKYGKVKGMEIIREYMCKEINNKRSTLGNKPLKLHPVINILAQSEAQDMADNEYFSHTDTKGKSASDHMIEDGRYDYQMYANNISFNMSTIYDVVQSYITNNKWKTGHYDVISVKGYTDIGVGLAKGKNRVWYIVVNYGKELPKK